jgi:hypothetical protein
VDERAHCVPLVTAVVSDYFHRHAFLKLPSGRNDFDQNLKDARKQNHNKQRQQVPSLDPVLPLDPVGVGPTTRTVCPTANFGSTGSMRRRYQTPKT